MMAAKPGVKYNTRQVRVTEKSENRETFSVCENSQDDDVIIIEHTKKLSHYDDNAPKPKITRGRLRRRTLKGRVVKPIPKRANSRALRASMRQLASKRKELNLKALVFPRTVESAKHPEVDGSVSNKILFASALGLLPGKFSIENPAITNDSRCPTKVTFALDKDRNDIYEETQTMIATINSAMMPPDNLNDSIILEMDTSPESTIINSNDVDIFTFDDWTNRPRFPPSSSSGIGSGSNSSSPSKVSAISTDTSESEDTDFGVGRKPNNRHPTQLGIRIENGNKRASKVVYSSPESIALIVEDVAIGVRGRDFFSLKLGETKNAAKGSDKNLPSLKQVTEYNDGSDTASEDETTGEDLRSFVFGNKAVQQMSVKIPSPDVDESMGESSSSEEEKKPKIKRKRQKFRRLQNGFILM